MIKNGSSRKFVLLSLTELDLWINCRNCWKKWNLFLDQHWMPWLKWWTGGHTGAYQGKEFGVFQFLCFIIRQKMTSWSTGRTLSKFFSTLKWVVFSSKPVASHGLLVYHKCWSPCICWVMRGTGHSYLHCDLDPQQKHLLLLAPFKAGSCWWLH